MYFAPPQNKMKTWLRACAHYRPVHNRSVMKVAIQDNCHFGQCVLHVTYKLSNSVWNIALRHVYSKSSRETAINSLGATILLLQHSVTKVSCRCCHVTHKSKAKVKVCTEAKLNGRKRVLIVGGINTMQYCESVQVIDSLTFVF